MPLDPPVTFPEDMSSCTVALSSQRPWTLKYYGTYQHNFALYGFEWWWIDQFDEFIYVAPCQIPEEFNNGKEERPPQLQVGHPVC